MCKVKSFATELKQYAIEAQWRVEVKFHAFLISAINRNEWPASSSTSFTRMKRVSSAFYKRLRGRRGDRNGVTNRENFTAVGMRRYGGEDANCTNIPSTGSSFHLLMKRPHIKCCKSKYLSLFFLVKMRHRSVHPECTVEAILREI
jgi:hypothetical protein